MAWSGCSKAPFRTQSGGIGWRDRRRFGSRPCHQGFYRGSSDQPQHAAQMLSKATDAVDVSGIVAVVLYVDSPAGCTREVE